VPDTLVRASLPRSRGTTRPHRPGSADRSCA
jgi:hypothetical protein